MMLRLRCFRFRLENERIIEKKITWKVKKKTPLSTKKEILIINLKKCAKKRFDIYFLGGEEGGGGK